jgi:hypothetical protein
MTSGEYLIPVAMGGVFAIVGIILIFLGRGEERNYYDSLMTRHDAREFLEHWPERPRVGALKIGGWICLAIGLLLIIMGGAFWLWG